MRLGKEFDCFLIVYIGAHTGQDLDRREPSQQLVSTDKELIGLRGIAPRELMGTLVSQGLQDALQWLSNDAWPSLKDGKPAASLTPFKRDRNQLPIVMAPPNGFVRDPQ